MSTRAGTALIVAIFTLGDIWGCSSVRTEQHKTPSADLWQYHTYAWFNDQEPGSKLEVRIKAVGNSSLAKMGFKQVSPEGNPDIYLIYTAQSDQLGYSTNSEPGTVCPPQPETHANSLCLLFVDAATHQTIWAGNARIAKSEVDEFDQATNQLISAYKSDRDQENSWLTKAMFFLNVK